MALNTTQTFFQAIIVLGMIFTGVGGFGSYWYGKKISSQNDQEITNMGASITNLEIDNQELLGQLSKIQEVNDELKEELTKHKGGLSPDNIPWENFADKFKDLPEDAKVLFLGSASSYTTKFPHTVIQIAGEDVLSIDKRDGRLLLNAILYSQDGKILAKIIENKFHVNQHNYFDLKKTEHSLKVIDQQGKEALMVHYLNPRSIKINGTFYKNGEPYVILKDDMTTIMGNSLNGFSFGENVVDISIN